MADQKTLEKQGEKPGKADVDGAPKPQPASQPPGELGGPKGLEPTRFGDWEVNGRCSDF